MGRTRPNDYPMIISYRPGVCGLLQYAQGLDGKQSEQSCLSQGCNKPYAVVARAAVRATPEYDRIHEYEYEYATLGVFMPMNTEGVEYSYS